MSLHQNTINSSLKKTSHLTEASLSYFSHSVSSWLATPQTLTLSLLPYRLQSRPLIAVTPSNQVLTSTRLQKPPTYAIHIPYPHALGEDKPTIPAYLSLPASPTPSTPVPLMIILPGLDGHRTDLAVWCPLFTSLGIAVLVLDIPGTGDCPASSSDPTSFDRCVHDISLLDTSPHPFDG